MPPTSRSARTGFDDAATQRRGRGGPSACSRSPACRPRRSGAVARRLAAGDGVYILTGRGVEQHVDGTDTATAAINLALALGLPGRADSGYGTLTGQGNGQGGREHGQKCDQLPGYRKITDPDARAHVAGVWGVDPGAHPRSRHPGRRAAAVARQRRRPARAARARLERRRVGAERLGRAGGARAARPARRVGLLPLRDRGTRRRRPARAAVGRGGGHDDEPGGTRHPPPPRARLRPAGVRDELWIMAELARRLDAPGTYSVDAREVFDELRRASAGGIADYSGIDDALLDAGAPVHWPCPVGSLGTPRLFADGFAHPDGRARIVAVAPAAARRPPPAARRADPDHRPAARALPERRPDPPGSRARRRAARSAGDAASGDGAERLRHRGGRRASSCRTSAASMRAPRRSCRRDVRPGDVFVPFHFAGDGTANLLTSDAVDPVSAMPEFKTGAVRVRRVEEAISHDRVPAARARGRLRPGRRALRGEPPARRAGRADRADRRRRRGRATRTTACWSPSTPSAAMHARVAHDRRPHRRRGRRRPHPDRRRGDGARPRRARVAVLSDGETIAYDRVVLATGSRANVPTLDGVPAGATHRVAGDDDDVLPRGVTALRDLADAERIRDAVAAGPADRRARRRRARPRVRPRRRPRGRPGRRRPPRPAPDAPQPRPRGGRRCCAVRSSRRACRSSPTAAPRPCCSTPATTATSTSTACSPRTARTSPATSSCSRAGLAPHRAGRERRSARVVRRRRRREPAQLDRPVGLRDRRLRAHRRPARSSRPAAASPARRAGSSGPAGGRRTGSPRASWTGSKRADADALPAEREPLVMLKAEHVDVVAAGDVSADPWDDDPRRAATSRSGPTPSTAAT